MNACRKFSALIPAAFEAADLAATRELIAREAFERFTETIPEALRSHLAGCSDCQNDVLWYLEIRDECDVSGFPCIHLAYAGSSKANHAVTREHGLFAISTGDGTGIVIGYCPWCGLELPVSHR